MTTNTELRWLPLALLLGLAGCGGSDSGTGDHGHVHVGSSDHAHGEEDSATLVYTDYTTQTELFVEFPALVAGQVSRFAVHVTRLDDHTPLTRGTLDVLLLQGPRTVARFRVDEPARTGIFTPAVAPREPGDFELVIEVSDGDLSARHELGSVTVFGNTRSVVVDQPEREGDIGYLKEQQWTNPFSTSIASHRPLRPSAPAFATIQVPADGGADVTAPADGYFAFGDLARAGDVVAAGEVLGHLIPRLGAGTDLGGLRVALERARAGATLAEQDVRRLEGLYQTGAVPEKRLLEAREALKVARTELAAARARISQLRDSNTDSGIPLRAPVAGEIIAAGARPGAFVPSGMVLFRIAVPERRWLEARVPERFAGHLDQASGAWFEHAANGVVVLDAERGATIVQTDTAIDPQTRTAAIVVEYPTSAGPKLVGAHFPAWVFTAPPREALAVPRSAVIDDGGRNVVYVQTGGEMFVRRPVELGIQDGPWVEVISGVAAGDRVVDTGAYYVKLAATGGDAIGHGHAH